MNRQAITGNELHYGVKAIADRLGMTPKQCEHRIAQGRVPVFRMGKTVCASEPALRLWLAQQTGIHHE